MYIYIYIYTQSIYVYVIYGHRYIDIYVRNTFIQNILLNAKFRFFLELS